MPSGSVGQDVQHPLAEWHEVGIGRGDHLPPVTAVVAGVPEAEHVREPGFPVAAVVGEGLAGPFAGDQDAATCVAEVLRAVSFALARSGPQSLAGVFRLDAVPQPVRAARRAGLVAQRLKEPVSVVALSVSLGRVAAGDVLGQVLSQVPDAPAGVS